MIKIFCLCCIIFVTNTSVAFGLELSELLVDISKMSEKFSRFTETRTSSFLSKPLVSKGNLEFKAPAILIKKLISPEKSEQRINGDMLSITNNDSSTQTLSLSTYPELEIGINAIRWVLSGDFINLKNSFDVTFKEYEQLWQLHLRPKNIDVIKKIKNITLIGKGAKITTINIEHTNDDSVIMDLYDHH